MITICSPELLEADGGVPGAVLLEHLLLGAQLGLGDAALVNQSYVSIILQPITAHLVRDLLHEHLLHLHLGLAAVGRVHGGLVLGLHLAHPQSQCNIGADNWQIKSPMI